jgi:arsenite-transporting ATPase
MSLAALDQTKQRVLMFGGKGGVGKTTSSAATALHYALAGHKTLIISSDLTPSLSDIFEVELGFSETPVPGASNLYALEISPDEVMRRWKEHYGPEVYRAASALVAMPYDEIVDYVALAPGIQEEFMLDYILAHVQDGSVGHSTYDLVVWDTAPAGDTLRLLGLPHRFLEHLRTAPRVYLQVQDAFQLSAMPFLDIIESWKELARQITSFLSDQKNVEFILVTIPEALGVYQSRRVIGDLAAHGLDVRHVIVNNVVVSADCDFHRQRMEMQRPYLELLKNEYGGRMTLTALPLLSHEVRGVERLKEVEQILFGEDNYE